MSRPQMTRRRDDSLIGRVVAANVVLVTFTLFAASLAAGLDISIADQRWQFLILALAIVLTLCVNLWMLQRRFAPLERLVDRVEAIDPAEPATFQLDDDPVDEIDRLAASFRGLLRRVDEERRRSGKLVLRAQEEERRRIARDLHDEVNQALTAVLLRLEALAQDVPSEQRGEVAELKRLTGQAMDELLRLARQLRPTALDDHGLGHAIETQVRAFGERTGVNARFELRGDPSGLDEETQTVVYRITQEALSNAAQHARPAHVDVALTASDGGAELLVRDDGVGFDPGDARDGGLGLAGMAERARLAGGVLDLRSSRGAGTELVLRLP
jgi:two-component system, NarL family, sensor histidine kinase UhpB